MTPNFSTVLFTWCCVFKKISL